MEYFPWQEVLEILIMAFAALVLVLSIRIARKSLYQAQMDIIGCVLSMILLGLVIFARCSLL